MKRLILVSALLLAVSGCATEPVPTNTATPVPANRILKAALTKPASGTGSLIVKRDVGLNTSGCTFRLYINGTPFADIDTGEKVQIYLKPGEYIIGSTPRTICMAGNAESSFVIGEGQTKIYRVSIGSAGELKLQPTAF
jgi:hypothetical protein